MAQITSIEELYDAFLNSDIDYWRSEVPQEATIQVGRYTYDAIVCGDRTEYLIYIIPDPFTKENKKYLVHLQAARQVADFWVPIVSEKFEVRWSGGSADIESWHNTETDNKFVAKIAEIVRKARPAHQGSHTPH